MGATGEAGGLNPVLKKSLPENNLLKFWKG